MKRLCFPQVAHRFGAPALFARVLGLAATAGCASQTVSGTGGGGAFTTSSASGGGMATATTSATTSTSSGGGEGGGGTGTTSSTGGGAGGESSATSSSSSSSTSSGTGGSPFIPPVGTADYPAETEQNDVKSSADALQLGTKGFTSSIWPLADIDIYQVDVTIGGSQLRVGLGDGLGGCPVGANTYMRIFDKNGALLASDKSSGPANCSLILPASNPSIQSLPVGQYFIQVENLLLLPIPFYVVDVKLTPPSCGDNIVQLSGSEQCDDGGNAAGDGCSPTCQLEGLYGTEVEPNNTAATANALGVQNGIIAAIGAAGDQDFFSFEVTVPGSSVTLTIDNGLGQCPPGFDSEIYLYAASNPNVVIVKDDQSGPANCSAILPTAYPAAANLAVGTYYVQVKASGNNSATPFYVLGVKVLAPACGDGLLQVGEQCDDGNVVNGDDCSATCTFEGNYIPETEPNDTQLTANPVGLADGFSGVINPIGDQDYFSFDVVTPGSSVFIQVTDGIKGCPAGFDSKLTLFSPNNALIVTVDDGGAAKCSLLSPATTSLATNLAVGTYKVRVEYNGNSVAIASYVVKIKILAQGCGDGVVQPATEQCDDSNIVTGDGCSSTCQAEAPFEIEPNGTIMTATPPWPGFTHWLGGITLADRDYYSFTLAAAATVTLTIHSVNNAATCPGDTLLHLNDSAGAEIAVNDDGGVYPCSKLIKALQPGTYSTWVQRYLDSQTIPAYQLDLTIQ